MVYLAITPYFPSRKSLIGPFVYDQVRAIERSCRFERILVMKPCAWYRWKLTDTFDGLPVYLFRSFQLPSKIFPDVFNRLNTLFFYRRLHQLGLKRDQEVVAHVHTSPLAKYGVWMKHRFPKSRLWVQHHDLDPLLIRMGQLRNVRWHQRMAVRNRVRFVSQADMQICVSELALRQLEAFPSSVSTTFPPYLELLKQVEGLSRVVIRDAYVLRNGADLRKFFPPTKDATDGAEMEREEPSAIFRIGCVAAFNELKGQMTLIRAVEELTRRNTAKNRPNDVEVVFIGKGVELTHCQSYVKEHALTQWVRFNAVCDHRSLRSFYQSLNLFVLPSFFETFACVYLEAYACGVPFICCRGQGNAESIFPQDLERWTVEPHDHNALADRIEIFMQDRTPQQLTHAYDIDELVGAFLQERL